MPAGGYEGCRVSFAKVFAQILDSSLADDYLTRLVFEDFLKLSDRFGIVDITPESISRRTNVPLDIVKRGIEALEQPDERSRTPDHDGKRIVRLDAHRTWGWKVVNYEKYRESATTEMLRMAEADRKREYRKKFPPRSPSSKERKSTEGDGEQSRTFRDSPTNVRDMSGTNGGSHRKRPSIEEAKAACPNCRCTPEEAGTWWNAREATEWMKASNGTLVPIGSNWQADLTGFVAAMRDRKSRQPASGKKPEQYNTV